MVACNCGPRLVDPFTAMRYALSHTGSLSEFRRRPVWVIYSGMRPGADPAAS